MVDTIMVLQGCLCPHLLGLVYVSDLNGERDFADIMKNLETGRFWIVWVGLINP